jgi:hypothetical protein
MDQSAYNNSQGYETNAEYIMALQLPTKDFHTAQKESGALMEMEKEGTLTLNALLFPYMSLRH